MVDVKVELDAREMSGSMDLDTQPDKTKSQFPVNDDALHNHKESELIDLDWMTMPFKEMGEHGPEFPVLCSPLPSALRQLGGNSAYPQAQVAKQMPAEEVCLVSRAGDQGLEREHACIRYVSYHHLNISGQLANERK